jgi:hypothetical protein
MAKVTRARISKKLRKHADALLDDDGYMLPPPDRLDMRMSMLRCRSNSDKLARGQNPYQPLRRR